jgi:hypothetical protein
MCSSHRYWAKLANPSFNQMCCHVRIATESPKHWWASSCAIVLVLRTEEYNGRVCVSSENPIVWPLYVALSAMAPVESKGYGPNVSFHRSVAWAVVS